MNNAYGLDADYFTRLCAREFNPDVIRNQNPEDLARAFARAARTACAEVLDEPEFSGALAAECQRLKNEADYYRNTLRNVLKDIRDDLARGGLPRSWEGIACTISVVLGYDRAALAGSKEGES